MPRTWPLQAVQGLNKHHSALNGDGDYYDNMMKEYSSTLALGVPWVLSSASNLNKNSEVFHARNH